MEIWFFTRQKPSKTNPVATVLSLGFGLVFSMVLALTLYSGDWAALWKFSLGAGILVAQLFLLGLILAVLCYPLMRILIFFMPENREENDDRSHQR